MSKIAVTTMALTKIQHQKDLQFTNLYVDHHHWLYRWLSQKLGCIHNAADIAHDTYMRILVTGKVPQAEQSRRYLTQIAKGKVIDHWRRQDVEQAYLAAIANVPETHVPSLESQAIVIDTLMELDALLHQVPEKPRQALLMSRLDGLSYAEIAQQLNVSISSVEKYIARALLALLQAKCAGEYAGKCP